MFPLLVPFVEVQKGDPDRYKIYQVLCKRFENNFIVVEVVFASNVKLHHKMSRFGAQQSEFIFVNEDLDDTISVGISLALEQDELLDYEPLVCKAYAGFISACFAPYGWTSSPYEILYDSINTNTSTNNSISIST